MSYARNETRNVLETITLGGVDVTLTEISYDYQPYSRAGDKPVERYTYTSIDVVGTDAEDLDALNATRIVLEALAQADGDAITLGGYNVEGLVEIIEEQASEIAEGLEIHFIYDRNGSVREYTPRSLWQPSGGCEWEESASEYDFGWDL